MDNEELKKQLRVVLADYMDAEGCGCCGNYSKQKQASEKIAKLLDVPMYEDGSGRDFDKFKTKEIIDGMG